MVNSMVERATSDMLIGPDWAMNIEICDMLNHDPGQAKDVVKGIKRRIGSRNSKVQLLALTLLETIIKNCGDIVHMHVAEKDVIHEMVKIVKKKPDIHVKEKILVLIDTWQEAFGGPRARYPQYYAAYQELLRAGAVFPQRSERAAPVFTPPQTQPLSSYPPNVQTSDTRQEAAEPSAESEFPSLSLSEIQNARGIMDVLSEMINAIDPENKEGLRQEVVIDLVEQCRTYKQRVVHLVNSTADESLLCQGLALNDDLQRLLAKHEAISSGKPMPAERPKGEAVRSLVDVDSPLVDTGATSKQPDGRAGSSAVAGDPLNQLLLTAPPTTNGSPPTAAKVNPKMDLLSGDDFSSPKAEASMALVPVGSQQPTNTPVSDQTALVLFDMLSDTNTSSNASDPQPGANLPGQTLGSLPPQQQGQQSFQSSQGGFYANGAVPNMGGPQYEQSIYNTQGGGPAWNGQIAQPAQLPQPTSPAYGSQSGGSLPPPPWEAQTSEAGPVSQYPQAMQATQGQMAGPVSQYPQAMQATQGQMAGPVSQYPQAMQATQGHLAAPHYQPGSIPMGHNEQPGGMYMQPIPGQVGPSGQMGYHHPQQQYMGMGMGMVPQGMQAGAMYPQQIYAQQQQMASYGYGQQPGQYLDQRMYGLSVADGNGMRNPYQGSASSASSYVPPSRPSKPEDKLFGDLVDIAKFKPVAK